jgi:hypothetical protein
LPPSAEIVDQIDPSLMRLRLDQYFMPLVKDAPLSSHGDASMRHVKEKDAPLVNQCRRLFQPRRAGSTMMAAIRLAIVWSSRLDRRSERAKPAIENRPILLEPAGRASDLSGRGSYPGRVCGSTKAAEAPA